MDRNRTFGIFDCQYNPLLVVSNHIITGLFKYMQIIKGITIVYINRKMRYYLFFLLYDLVSK